MKHTSLLLYFILLSFLGMAQAPGYMGKKLSLSYESQVFPAVLRANGNNRSMSGLDGAEQRFFSFSTKHSILIDRVINRRQVIGASFLFYNTRALYDKHLEQMIYPVDSMDMTSKGDMSVKGFSIYLRNFLKGHIAPAGRHNTFELFFLFHKSTYRKEDFTSNSNYPYLFPPPDLTGESKGMNAGLAYSFSKERIYFDAVKISFGARFGWVFGALRTADDLYDSNYIELYDAESYFKTLATKRLARCEVFNFRIGIGYLAGSKN